MAAKSEWSCPICYDDQEDIACMSPCMHQFGLGCAMRWAQEKGTCPLCRTVTRKIVVSALADNDSFTFEIEGATEPSAEASEASDHEVFLGSDMSNDDFLMSDDLSPTGSAAEESEEEEEGSARLFPGGFPLEAWAEFFSRHPDNIRPLLLWLRRELGRIYCRQWWEAAVVERSVVVYLCLWGLDEELLVHHLQHSLQEETSTFVQQLIAAAVNLCRDGILQQGQQQDPHATGEDNDSAAASSSSTVSWEGTPNSSSSPTSSAEEEDDGLSAGAEQEQPPEGPEEAAASGPSAPGRGRDRSLEQPRRPPKRRPSSPQDGPPPPKRLP